MQVRVCAVCGRGVLTVHCVAVDVGYTLPSVNDVINEYVEEWFPAALTTIAALNKRGGEEQFIWTTHPWLLTQILNNASQ